MSLITSELLICWLRTTGSCPPCFFHVMTGRGSLEALQFNLTVPLNGTTTFAGAAGGLTIKRGSEATTKSVFFSTLPKRFDAEQK